MNIQASYDKFAAMPSEELQKIIFQNNTTHFSNAYVGKPNKPDASATDFSSAYFVDNYAVDETA